MQNTKKLVTAALMAALTCIATMVIKVPTPTMGYIHLGDGFVLMCGVLLGPWAGALAAGIGSMFADIFSGYASWAIATLLIKALTAMIAGLIFHGFCKMLRRPVAPYIGIFTGGLAGEAVMVLGYFLFETGLAGAADGSFSAASLAAGVAASAAGIPFNIVQGAVGIVISALLMPLLLRLNSETAGARSVSGK